MSWFSANYEKAVLGGAAVIAIGFAYTGWSKIGSIEEDFNNPPDGPPQVHNPAVEGAEAIPMAVQSLDLARTHQQAKDPEGRAVYLHTGVALFLKRDGTNKPIDIVSGANIHPGIPNHWWIEHEIDPGYANAPDRDPDGDGFSNREEYLGDTDPNDDGNHPPLITKLRFVEEKSLVWVLKPSFMAQNGAFPFEFNDGQGRKNRRGAADMVNPGDVFFDEEPAKGRFKLLGHEDRKIKNEAINMEENVTFARVQDLKANKGGRIYEIPAPLKNRDVKKHLQYDRSAVLRLEALGLGAEKWEVEENTRFALPSDAPEKEYLLKEITPDRIIVEYVDANGEKKPMPIEKEQ